MMFWKAADDVFISTKWKLSFQWVKASPTISNRFLPFGRTVESETLHRKTQINRVLRNMWRVLKKRNGCNMMKYFFDFKDYCQIFADFRLNLCAFVSSCFINNISHAEWMEYAEVHIINSVHPKLCVSKSKEIFGAFVFFIYLCPILILSTLQGCFHQSGVRRPKLEQKPTWEGGDDIDV